MGFRVGIGYDIHQIIEGEYIFLGGVRIPCSFGLKGHSDADVVSHAVTDAILGALGEKDIGYHFSNEDIQNKDRSSKDFLTFARNLMKNKGFSIENIDINIICEKPKIKEYRGSIEKSLATILNVSSQQINAKGKTNEKLDSVGEGRSIISQAVILISRY